MDYAELSKITTYSWGKRQTRQDDIATNWIYQVKSYDELVASCEKQLGDNQELCNYAMARWYNLNTHDFALSVFLKHPSVRAEARKNNRTIDLFINDVPFDIKLSVWPKKLVGKTISDKALIEWFNAKQSFTRKHLKGKIFIVVLDEINPELSWQVKRELNLVTSAINEWLESQQYITLNKTPFALIKVYK